MPGGSITVSVRVVNEGSELVRLNFSTTQRFEILVQTGKAALYGGGPMASILPRYLSVKGNHPRGGTIPVGRDDHQYQVTAAN